MTQNYYSHGKILLSGEYMVLCGASAIVLPLKPGQLMEVTETEQNINPLMNWNAHVLNEPWFVSSVQMSDWSVRHTSDPEMADYLVKIMREVAALNPLIFRHGLGFDISTNTEFNINWGLGSSSSLIANIAHWAVTDPFKLYFNISSGSGADLAGAISDGPVIYRLLSGRPCYQRIPPSTSLYPYMWLIYSGRKQNTAASVNRFLAENKVSQTDIDTIDSLTKELAGVSNLAGLKKIIREHEQVLSRNLNIPVLKDSVFSDFNGEVKSLGAWGGDFILAVSGDPDQVVHNYFKSKGMNTVLSLKELVL